MSELAHLTLAGKHIRLEPLALDHAADLFVAAQDDEVWRWLYVARPSTEGAPG
jgi:hypothetical protein